MEKVCFCCQKYVFAGQNEEIQVNASTRRYRLNKYITEMSGRDIMIWGVGTFFTCLLSEFVYEHAYLCLLGLQSTHWTLI